MRTILITGGAGFIGSNLVRYWLNKYKSDVVVNIDSFTYAARHEWVDEFLESPNAASARYFLERVDIRDQLAVSRIMKKYKPTDVIHLAAESHVCRSITGPKDFVTTNVLGTFNLLEEFRALDNCGRFLHVSTDEVFGELEQLDAKFCEFTPLDPRSPYSATKAASDLLVKAYGITYGMDVVVTNCSNNFGQNQHEEKLIPRTITRILDRVPVTIYGPGTQIRDWLFVGDHCSALDCVFTKGTPLEKYCIGGDHELTNFNVIKAVHETVKRVTKKSKRTPSPYEEIEIIHTNDRPTDDFRYAIDRRRLERLGWKPNPASFEAKLELTVQWYIDRHKFTKVESGAV